MTMLLQLLTLVTGTLAFTIPSGDHLNHLQKSSDLKPRQTCDNTATSRDCWGDYSIDTNYYDVVPSTGVNREYWLSIEEVACAPDGYNTTCLTFNGTVPGPTLFADWGDTMTVHVTNNVVNNGTTVHWHGVRQLNNFANDGVPGVTQCPISPETTQTYEFQVTQYGSTWYHSHFTLQYGQGLFGGLIFNGPATADYDEDLGMLFLGDWHHTDVFELWETARAGAPPTLQSGLINGTNIYNCTANADMTCKGTVGSKYETVFEAGQKYRIRLVNVAIDGHFQFSIDGHSLTVIATDLVPIVPYTTDSVLVSIGQRVDVIVEANATPGDYWLRGGWLTTCSQISNVDDITGIVRYDSSSTADPTSNNNVTASSSCSDEPYASIVPYLALDVGDISVEADQALGTVRGTVFTWTLNNSSLLLDWANPTIQQIAANDTAFPTAYNVVSVNGPSNSTNSSEWALLVIEDDSGFGITHPIHLHGHDFWVVSQSTDAYEAGVTELTLTNPPRRDVASLPGNGHLALAFKLDNPGAWIVHCHIAWHASQGLAMEFVESQNQISSVSFPLEQASEITDQCTQWNSYITTDEYGGQDDSGI